MQPSIDIVSLHPLNPGPSGTPTLAYRTMHMSSSNPTIAHSAGCAQYKQSKPSASDRTNVVVDAIAGTSHSGQGSVEGGYAIENVEASQWGRASHAGPIEPTADWSSTSAHLPNLLL